MSPIVENACKLLDIPAASLPSPFACTCLHQHLLKCSMSTVLGDLHTQARGAAQVCRFHFAETELMSHFELAMVIVV